MAKRFTDTAIWQDEWFMSLPVEYKLAFMFIKDNCDVAGIWKPNKKLANMMIGFEVDWDDFLIESGPERFLVLKNGSWWLIKFIEFQYGNLSEKCKPHLKVIDLLQKHQLFDRVYKGYTKGIQRVEEKDKYKEEEEDKEEDKGGVGEKIQKVEKIKFSQFVSMTDDQYAKLIETYGPELTQKFIESLDSYKGSKGKTYKCDYRAILSWVVEKVKGQMPKQTISHVEKRLTENEQLKVLNAQLYGNE